MSVVDQVLNLKFYKGEDLYSDGDVEDRILELCQSGRPFQEILMEDNDWPILYHLSDVRHNVLEWYDFDPGPICWRSVPAAVLSQVCCAIR